MSKLSKIENFLLEADLFAHLCENLKKILQSQCKNYYSLINIDIEMEETMTEEKLLRYVINDILATEEYTLAGIAYHTQIPEEVLYNLASGSITNPSSMLFRKIINIHRLVRPELYREIIKKIISDYLKYTSPNLTPSL